MKTYLLFCTVFLNLSENLFPLHCWEIPIFVKEYWIFTDTYTRMFFQSEHFRSYISGWELTVEIYAIILIYQ